MFWEYWDHPSQGSCCSGGNITFPVAQQPLKSEGDRVDLVGAQGGERWQQNATHMAWFNAFAKKQSNFFHRMTRSLLAWQDESLANGMD
jgi:hypothetical protein